MLHQAPQWICTHISKLSIYHKQQPVHTTEPPNSFSTKDLLIIQGTKKNKRENAISLANKYFMMLYQLHCGIQDVLETKSTERFKTDHSLTELMLVTH